MSGRLTALRLAPAALLLVLLGAPPRAQAQVAEGPRCYALNEDRQGSFASIPESQRQRVDLLADGRLRLDTNVVQANPEAGLKMKFDQQVSVDFVFTSGTYSWTFGYVLMGDLVARGYVDLGAENDPSDDRLLDRDGNGIADFHEDLYNLNPGRAVTNVPGSTQLRCGAARFRHTWAGTERAYRVPALASSDCADSSHTPDGQPPRVGSSLGTRGQPPFYEEGEAESDADWISLANGAFSDGGKYAHVPNLLEPGDAREETQGLGHLVFLNAGDDDDTATRGVSGMPPAADVVGAVDGIPDYDTSAYDSFGNALPTNRDPGVTASDRRVDLGTFTKGTELVFFLVTYGYENDADLCLIPSADNSRCELELRTPVSVFFSRSFLNMDRDTDADRSRPVATLDLGCPWPRTNCASGARGWLDQDVLDRLRDETAYDPMDMPTEADRATATVARTSTRRMPHVLVGAPPDEPFRWILGFEDVVEGGDRDFNDLVFVVNRQNVGDTTSGTLSADISPTNPALAQDYTITTVRFTRDDDETTCPAGRTPPCFHEEVAGACRRASPDITYQVAVNCRVFNPTTRQWEPNAPASIDWQTVVFPPQSPPVRTVELNMLDLGFTGSQLCWRVSLQSSNQFCQPTVNDVGVRYEAIRAGEYTRASVTPAANAVFWTSREMPGSRMSPPASVNTYATALANPDADAEHPPRDLKRDLSARGHLWMSTLYAPETPRQTLVQRRWDAGDVLSDALNGRSTVAPTTPEARKLFTSAPGTGGGLLDLDDELAVGNTASRGFDASVLCREPVNGRYVYDLDRDGACDGDDRAYLRDWLRGYERRADPAQLRAWPLGGFDLSTPAFVGSAGDAQDTPNLAGRPAWYRLTSQQERTHFRTNFVSRYVSRPATVYAGTVNGFLHGFDAGQLRWGNDDCTPANELRGYFTRTGTACATGTNPRSYGTGAERFAYLPSTLLGAYLEQYVQYAPASLAPRASVNTSPSVADVDLGGLDAPPWTPGRARGRGAKTALVSTTGAHQNTVFALDVSDPTEPLPMFEYVLGAGAEDAFQGTSGQTVVRPDTRGARHSPAIVRMRFRGLTPELRWVAVVATDYVPAPGTAGALYFLDLATGRPVSANGEPRGIVTLEEGMGVSGEPVAVDVDQNGIWDVVYVATTSGQVFRVNPAAAGESVPGRQLAVCQVADVAADLNRPGQMVHSPLAARVTATGTGTVQLFLATSDNPDSALDVAEERYNVLGYEDASPLGDCDTPDAAVRILRAELPPGERAWGGVTVDDRNVYVATAVGESSQPCALDTARGGALYQVPITASAAVRDLTGQGQSLGGAHAVSPPVAYDGHVFIPSLEGAPKLAGDGAWNTSSATRQGGTRVLMFDVRQDGRLPR